MNIAVGQVLFTDESRFNIQDDSRRAMIWREPGTRYQAPKRPLQRWRVTCLGRDSNERPNRPLRVRWGSVTDDRYRDEILHPLAWHFIAAMGTDAILMDDNAHPHRARLVRSYLESETIPRMAWLARSPDLNPIEHVWVMLGRRIACRSVPLGTLQELQQALLQEWPLLPQQAINDIIASMPRCCQACISARWYHTRYYRVVPIAHSA
ncbi:hypothetical protein AVEN_90017-1 [Araneus ventricosus]|uniref:Tc1-like transposase DDE domain-containing protein n=1 Tax=Araneus ventricosus TaxID=182803 RepID=A0A4Y2DAD0_ARAVE|nr:hypothetical protein AVEN_90017-1 [Araneus ventricosus]